MEIAAVVTDVWLDEVDKYHSFVYVDPRVLDYQLSAWSQDQHNRPKYSMEIMLAQSHNFEVAQTIKCGARASAPCSCRRNYGATPAETFPNRRRA
jgi:hypothetical protein